MMRIKTSDDKDYLTTGFADLVPFRRIVVNAFNIYKEVWDREKVPWNYRITEQTVEKGGKIEYSVRLKCGPSANINICQQVIICEGESFVAQAESKKRLWGQLISEILIFGLIEMYKTTIILFREKGVLNIHMDYHNVPLTPNDLRKV